MRPADLDIDLDAFSGPFDLLCTILLRRELELADVQVVEIVVTYVQQLAAIDQVDPDTASEFLLLIGALLEIKARELLASDDVLDIEEPAQAVAAGEMLERLVRYETFKGAAGWLGERGRRQRFWRVASRPVIRQKRTYDGPVIDSTLLHRAMTVLLAQPGVDVRHLVGKHASVHEMTGRLLSLLRSRASVTLDDITDGLSRLDQAVAFVAALELCKNGQIALAQGQQFGPIQITAAEVAADGDDVVEGDGMDAAPESTETQIA